MKVLSNKRGTMYRYVKQNNFFDYVTLSGQFKRVKTGDFIEVEGFRLPCKVGHSDCRGCVILSDSPFPICLRYGGEYGIKEVIE